MTLVELRRVDLVQKDLTIELSQECLYEFKNTFIQLFSLRVEFVLFINSDCSESAAIIIHALSKTWLILEASGRMLIDTRHRDRVVAVRTEHFLVIDIDRLDGLLLLGALVLLCCLRYCFSCVLSEINLLPKITIETCTILKYMSLVNSA